MWIFRDFTILLEFSGNKLQTIHIIDLWKASALGMKEDEMVQKFKAEMTLVQEAHKEHGRKRSLTQVKADWNQAAKRVCRRLEEPYEKNCFTYDECTKLKSSDFYWLFADEGMDILCFCLVLFV